ncbi:MAG TPA: glycosyltransferase family 2 protein [bacterium]|nr:glycosyltransferase family 2 protein [bacterium]
MFDLAIIIVSYKTKDLLDRCLASVFTLDHSFTHRVVVVDNNSNDGTKEMVIGKYPDALYVENENNVGFSVANNQGIRKSDSRFILLLNPDTEVNQSAIASMLKFLENNHGVGVVGCQLLNSDGTDQTSSFKFPIPLSRYFEKMPFYDKLSRKVLKINEKHLVVPVEGAEKVDIVKGACLMIRRETANQVGLLDENSFLYADDIDWCIRTAKRGWSSYILRNVNIIHHGYASTEQEPYITITSSRRSAIYLYKKHYSTAFTAIWVSLIFGEVVYKWALNWLRVKMGKNSPKTLARYAAYRDLAAEMMGRKTAGKS